MPEDYKQSTRPMKLTTPLGDDKLLLEGFEGQEEISGLFSFRLNLLATNTTRIEFDKLLGQKMVLAVQILDANPDSTEPKYRYFGGICRRFSQGNRDDTFTSYQAEMVPQFWLLTRRAQCRIFQHKSVPDILKKVLEGLDVEYQLTGKFEPRDYCVQYRETDFNFASRLMEEEGIFYFFKHKEDGHKLVVADSAPVHPDVPGPVKARWRNMESGGSDWNHIHEWQKIQEVRSGKVALWDHCFERPNDNFESRKNTLGSVVVGKVTHKLEVAGNDKLEIYDYPGEFAQRFDGIDKGGGAQAAELGKISGDGTRTVELRMQAETVAALVIQGASNCSHFTSGHKFTLEEHFDAEGNYLLSSVHHTARGGNAYRTGGDDTFVYSNSFTCIPMALPFRPQRTTPKPCVMGAQTATVVGPAGETIFPDKYGRVKVQFRWDREGKHDADSSCWIRVSQPWGGKGWGGMFIPHVGQEMVVCFEEGDPDRPLITGRVYNPDQMPPIALPDGKTKSVIRDHGGNEIVMEGGGEQQIKLYSPHANTLLTIGGPGSGFHFGTDKDFDTKISGNKTEFVLGYNKTKIVSFSIEHLIGANTKFIGGWKHESVTGVETKTNLGNKTELIVGSQIKVHRGTIVELKGDKRTEKVPRHVRAIGSALSKIGEYKAKIAKGYNEWIGGRAQKEMNELIEKGKSARINWGIRQEDIDELKQKVDKYSLKASNAKLKADAYKVLAKMDVNDGTFKVT